MASKKALAWLAPKEDRVVISSHFLLYVLDLQSELEESLDEPSEEDGDH